MHMHDKEAPELSIECFPYNEITDNWGVGVLPQIHEKYIYRKLDMSTFKQTNSKRKQILPDYVICEG